MIIVKQLLLLQFPSLISLNILNTFFKYCSVLACGKTVYWLHSHPEHLPLNSARFGYATEEALFISAQLSTDAVSALQKVWVLV